MEFEHNRDRLLRALAVEDEPRDAVRYSQRVVNRGGRSVL